MAEAALLTDAAVRNYRPRPVRRRIRDRGARSLFLVISPSGHKSWMMRLRGPDGRTGKMIIGPVDLSGHELDGAPVVGQPLTLSAARMLAASLLRDRALGNDVVREHKARKLHRRRSIEDQAASSFATAARDYIDEHARPNLRGWRETARILGLAYPEHGEPEPTPGGLVERWGDRSVRSIDRAAILVLIDECRRRGIPGLGVGTAGLSDARGRKMLSRLSGLFGWLMRRGRVDANPCTGIDCGTAARRERVLSRDELRWLWRACDQLGPHGSIVRLLILTGARLRECAGMRRSELRDGGRARWELPGGRTKNKRPHSIPLAPLARRVIEAGAGPFEIMFSVTGGRTTPEGWTWAKSRLDALMLTQARAERGPDATIAPWVLHDVRRTVVTGLAELRVPVDVIEKTVNHLSGTRGGVAGVYNRSELLDERRAALERWAAHIAQLLGRATTASAA